MVTTNKGNKKSEAAPPTSMVPPPTETALAEVDFGDDAGTGFDNVTSADMILPLLVIVQDKSKIVKNGAAKPGQIFLTSTGEAFDFVEIVAAMTDHCYLEWTPRDNGGGFKGRHAIDSDIVKDTLSVAKSRVGKHATMRRGADGKLTASGTELIEAFEIWVVIGNGEGNPVGYGLISCSSMKIKPYKQWVTKLRHFQIPRPNGAGRQDVPMFANRTIFRVREEKNAKGEFWNPTFDPFVKATDSKTPDLVMSMLTPKSPMYVAGKELRQLVIDKKVTADYAASDVGSSEGGAEEGADAAF